MGGDNLSLTKYIIRRQFPAKYIVLNEEGQRLFQASKPFTRKKIELYPCNSPDMPLVKITWESRMGLTAVKYKYSITDGSFNPIACVECNKAPAFTMECVVKDVYGKEVGLIKPDQMGYPFNVINILCDNTVKEAVFYQNTHRAISYVMDLGGDKEKRLDRRLALSLAVILVMQEVPMSKYKGTIDWNESVAAGDDIYRIKRR